MLPDETEFPARELAPPSAPDGAGAATVAEETA
jgi:hypothetical protein